MEQNTYICFAELQFATQNTFPHLTKLKEYSGFVISKKGMCNISTEYLLLASNKRNSFCFKLP